MEPIIISSYISSLFTPFFYRSEHSRFRCAHTLFSCQTHNTLNHKTRLVPPHSRKKYLLVLLEFFYRPKQLTRFFPFHPTALKILFHIQHNVPLNGKSHYLFCSYIFTTNTQIQRTVILLFY